MKIEFADMHIEERTVNHEKGSFTVREQEAFLFISEEAKYPTRFTVQLGEAQKAYEPGLYTLGAASFYVNRYGQLTLKRELVLEAISK